jgi:CBS domain-containing protein
MESAPKKPRVGVGSSVATLLKGPADDFLLTLAKTTVSRLVPSVQSIVVASRKDSISTVFKSMAENNILSVMVLTLRDKKLHGYIEISDMARWIGSLYRDVPLDDTPDFHTFKNKRYTFDKLTVKDVIPTNRGRLNPYHPVHKDYSLLFAWEILARSGAHRVPVVDETFTLWDIITQSMLVDFLWQNIEKTGNLAQRPIGTVFGNDKEVRTISQDAPAINALRQMYEYDVHGLAVIDGGGKLVDNFSERDLKVVLTQGSHLDVDKFRILWDKSVKEVKSIIRSKYPKIPELVYVLPNDNFFSLIEKMATLHVHRVYVVDSKENMNPKRCISQTDVLLSVIKCYS